MALMHFDTLAQLVKYVIGILQVIYNQSDYVCQTCVIYEHSTMSGFVCLKYTDQYEVDGYMSDVVYKSINDLNTHQTNNLVYSLWWQKHLSVCLSQWN